MRILGQAQPTNTGNAGFYRNDLSSRLWFYVLNCYFEAGSHLAQAGLEITNEAKSDLELFRSAFLVLEL